MSGLDSWRGLGGLAFAFLLTLSFVSPASASAGQSASPSLWGVEVDAAGTAMLERPVVGRLRATRAMLVASPGLSKQPLDRLRAVARRSELSLLEELPTASSTALVAGRDAYVVRVRRVSDLVRIGARGSVRVIAILEISRRSSAGALRRAIRNARASATLDLVVRPVGRAGKRALARYLGELGRVTRGDVVPPTQPGAPVATPSVASVSMTWTAAQDNQRIAGYGLYRDGEFVGTTKRTTASFTDLTCATHELAVDAYDQAGNRSPTSSVTTALLGCPPLGDQEPLLLDPPIPPPPLPCVLNCPDTTAPSQPGNFRSTGRTQTSVSLAWDAASDDRGVTAYQLYRNGSPVQTTSGTSATVSSLACGTTYEFGVEARDAAGNASTRASMSVATTECPDTQPPSDPQGMAFTERTQTSVGLRWDAATDNVGVTGYRLYRNNQLVATVQALTYTFTGLTCGTSYTFAVEAVDAAGNASNRAHASGTTSTTACTPAPDTQAPSQPGNLTKSAGSGTSVSLTWSASTDNVGVSGYRVYRDGTLVASPTGTSHTVSGLVCGTSYAFGVEARDAAGNTSPRATLTASTSACAPSPDTSPPSPPSGMTFGTRTQTSVAMTWNASTDNVGVAGYRLFRNGVEVATTTQRSYTFTGLTCGTSNTFAIEAYDAAGNASNRAAATGTASTAACDEPPPPPDGTTPAFFVSPSGSDANACTQAAPCASFDRAYRASRPGDVVQVAGGTYADQSLRAIAGRTGPNVVFRPAPSAQVTLNGLGFGGSDAAEGPDYITVKNMRLSSRTAEPGQGNQEGIWIGPGSTNITLEGMDAGSVNTWFADRVTVKGGDYGPCHAVWGSPNVCGNTKFDVSTNVLVDGATFHDYRFDETCFTVSGADCHWECMYINGSRNVTVRNSKFRACAIFDIFATISGSDAAQLGHENLVIENNWFGAPYTESLNGGSPSRPTAVSLAWCQNSPKGYKNAYVRFNSFAHNTQLQLDHNQDCVFDNVQVVGNLQMWDGCQSRWSFQYNVWSSAWRTGSCSSTDKVAGSTFPYADSSSGASMDYHLTGAAGPADNLVPVSAGCPATDIDGQPRPTTGYCEAGADER